MPDYHGKRGGKKKTGGMKMGKKSKTSGNRAPTKRGGKKRGKMSREEFIERGENALGDMPL
jgi:hypothetical protein